MRSSRIAIILRSVEVLAEPIRVHGATAASQALIAAQCVEAGRVPWVVLCADNDAAEEFSSDLECLSSVLGPDRIQVTLFPTWEQSAYSPISPSIRTRLARLSALDGVLSGGVQILVTSLAAMVQATLPRKVFESSTLSLETEGSVESRERLTARLLEAGYLRVDTVEDPGTFAVRGEIVDVFTPSGDRPVRIELFGDQVEKIRFFDPATQRTASGTEVLRKYRIPPAREVMINQTTAPILREKIKARADDQGVSRAARDPILSSVQSGSYAEHSDAWAPFAYENPESLWHYLAPESRILWVDEMSCLQRWDEFLADQKSLAEQAVKSGLILPLPSELFHWDAPLEKLIRARSRLFLDRVRLADLSAVPTEEPPAEGGDSESEEKITALHGVFVRGNSDLVQGSRQSLENLEPKLQLWMKQRFKTIALASTQSQLERIRFLLQERGFACQTEAPPLPGAVTLRLGNLSDGFRWPAEGLVMLTESDILGSRHVRKQKRKPSESGSAAKDWAGLQALSDLGIGDAVVHVDHGIGRYQGLVRLDLSGAPSDFLLLEYANRDKLYLPVYRLNVIQKYVGAGEGVSLDRLGSQQFAKTKEKVRDSVKKLAIDLIQLYAERKIRPGIRFSPRDAMFREFEAKFPFDETPDQLKAIDDILSDMESGKVMDRIICGDVGYGKTEVAMRAAFRAISDGKQVAVLVPTTVLAFQHEQSFRTRFKDYPISIEAVSRFKSSREQKRILEDVASGKIDLIIGTHRLLSKDVRFRDLGLVIVDEEHRFGVEHKERLKTLRVNTHVLTLTATPIPRTLHMALSGLRDISLINTAPVDRLPIRTYVSKFDEALVQRSIEFELSRGGQVFFLHNRVQTIHEIASTIQRLVPRASVGIGHGQMPEGGLEKVMVDFYQKKSNVLVCTTIIESGLDVPSANTILINRSDSLGLAQLYQIRGRVGRGQQRAYAYLLIPAEGAVTEDAKRRLEVIQKFVELGSGFSIASHDLEIRGGGDLLGPQQSGSINAVGFDLYTELLEEAIRELEGKPLSPEESSREPEIKAPFPSFLGEDYVPDIHQRLSLYRRFSAAKDEAEIDRLEEELRDRFGSLPVEAQNLLWLIRVKQLLKLTGIEALTVGPEKVSLVPGSASRLDPAKAIALISSKPDRFQILPDSKLVAKVSTASLRDLFFGLETLFRDLGAA